MGPREAIQGGVAVCKCYKSRRNAVDGGIKAIGELRGREAIESRSAIHRREAPEPREATQRGGESANVTNREEMAPRDQIQAQDELHGREATEPIETTQCAEESESVRNIEEMQPSEQIQASGQLHGREVLVYYVRGESIRRGGVIEFPEATQGVGRSANVRNREETKRRGADSITGRTTWPRSIRWRFSRRINSEPRSYRIPRSYPRRRGIYNR